MRERVWTSAEDERLTALRAAGLPWQIVAKNLGRTEAATVSRAGTLQLRRLTPQHQPITAKPK
jgi:hypothetical protein